MELSQSRKSNICLEYIDFQKNDNFGKQAEIIFEDISKAIKKGLEVKDISQIGMLEKLTHNRFGIKVSIVDNKETIMATLPLQLNKHHIFLNDIWKGHIGIKEQEVFIRTFNEKKGYVDLENAKVSGIFSEYKHYIFINFDACINKGKLTPGELTAVYLHELGHLFNHYEFSHRVSSTNEILYNLSIELNGNNDVKKIEYIYKEYKNKTGIKDDDNIFGTGKSRIILGRELFIEHIKYVNSQWKDLTYDKTSSEVSADVFSSRFGYGRELISALEKINNNIFGFSYSSRNVFSLQLLLIFFEIIIPLFLISLFLTASGNPVLILLSLYILFSLLINIWNTSTNNKDMTYDGIKDRYIRVRQQYVQLLKGNIPKNEAQSILEDIYEMDKFIAKVKNFDRSTTFLMDLINPNGRAANNDIKLQRLIEELAHNELFVKSQELKLMSSGA